MRDKAAAYCRPRACFPYIALVVLVKRIKEVEDEQRPCLDLTREEC